MARFQPTLKGKSRSGRSARRGTPYQAWRLAVTLLALAAWHSAGHQLAADEFPAQLIRENPLATNTPFTANPVSNNTEIGRDEFQTSIPARVADAGPTCPVVNCGYDDALSAHEKPVLVLTSGVDSTPAEVIAPIPEGDCPNGSQSFEACTDRPPIRFSDDAWCFLPRLGHDAWGLVNWNDAAILGVALGGSLAIRSELDGTVRNWTAEHPDRWGEGSKIIGNFGVAQYQIPVILGAYVYTVYAQNAEQHDMMCSLISAYTLTGLNTLVIKGIADTSRPSDQWNGGKFGFPSYHTASLFSISAVLDEYEGHWIGVPAYLFSGLVGWARIDTRDHDLSDVVFGAVMGYVIGKSVAGKALYGDSRVHILPYVHPLDGSPGLLFDVKF
jgi:hypothetical protein